MVAGMRSIFFVALLAGCGGKKDTGGGTPTTPPASHRAAADASLKPAGSGWFCTTATSGPNAARGGGCFREEQTCKDTIAEPYEDGTVYGPCTPQPTAFCHTQFFVPDNARDFFCRPTMEKCTLVADDWAIADGSDYRDVSTCAEWD
jgi:hypothetical protein